MNDLDYIVAHLSLSERAAQLAEEAAELAQAALKYRRALDGVNPTPVTVGEAESRVIDEFGDVLTCMACMTKPEDVPAGASENVKAKAARWRQRLEERGRKEDGEKPVV